MSHIKIMVVNVVKIIYFKMKMTIVFYNVFISFFSKGPVLEILKLIAIRTASANFVESTMDVHQGSTLIM